MEPETSKRIMVRSAFHWIAAIGIPVIVMIDLDAFDTHTPDRIATVSSFLIFFVFAAHNVWLARQLSGLTESTTT